MTRRCCVAMLLCLAAAVDSASGQSTGPAAAADQDNVIVVLDASGSMKTQMRQIKKTRMQAAKEALLAVMQDVPATTNVGLLVFSSANLKNDWAYPLKPVDRQALAKAINSPQPGGGTPLGAYLKKGADALLKQRGLQHGFGTYRLLVVTDGEATDKELVARYLPDVLSRGVTVDVIGVDMSSDLALAKEVHSYRRADDPASLVEAVKNVFAEVGSGKTDAAQSAADFALIEPIPDAMAAAILAALSNVADHPIGEAVPARPTGAAPSSAAAQPSYDPFQPGIPPQPGGRSGVGRFFAFVGKLCFYGFIVLVIVGIILANLAKQQRRNR